MPAELPTPGEGVLAPALGYHHLEVVHVGLKVLEMGNPALLLRETQGTGLSSFFLLTLRLH